MQGHASSARSMRGALRSARNAAALSSEAESHLSGNSSLLNHRTMFRSQPAASRASDNSRPNRPSTSTAARPIRSIRRRQASEGEQDARFVVQRPQEPVEHREQNRHYSRSAVAHDHDAHIPLQSASAGAHPQDEQAQHENAPRNPMLRRRPAAPGLERRARAARTRGLTASLVVPVPATGLESRAREDPVQNQNSMDRLYDRPSQTCTSSSCERCPVCTLPVPCDNHGHGDENMAQFPRSGSSNDRVPLPIATTSSTRASGLTRFAGSEISGMHRRPRPVRRPTNSQVEDELASTSVDTQADADSARQDPIVGNAVSWDHDAPSADPIDHHTHRLLSSMRQTPSPSASRNIRLTSSDSPEVSENRFRVPDDAANSSGSPEGSENRSQVPHVAANGSRRMARGIKKNHPKPVQLGPAGEQALPSLNSCPVEDCPICLAPLVGKCVKTRCGHDFHADCLEQHLLVTAVEQPTCPLCRGEMRLKLPVSAEATSGSPIDVVHRVPPVDSRCHLDRGYTFLSLGDFAEKPKMLYIRTSNEDKWTSAKSVMWKLTVSVPTTVYLNFRSMHHVSETGVMKWLKKQGWAVSDMESTVSTGWPNGPYKGPVFEKDFDAGQVELLGSNCHEGTYFVFVELRNNSRFDTLPWDLSDVLQ